MSDMEERQYKYNVMGKGDFPWDMLRYDRVWPLDPPEPHRMDSNGPWGKVRTVEVQGLGCTPDRWSSFGWVVDDPNRDGFSHGLGCIEDPPRIRTEPCHRLICPDCYIQ